MAFTEKQLGRAQIASGSQTTLYTVPASTMAIIRDIMIVNTTSTDRTVEVWLVPNGGSPADNNKLIADMTVYANDCLHWQGWQVLGTAGDMIQAEASAASAITIIVSGAEVT